MWTRPSSPRYQRGGESTDWVTGVWALAAREVGSADDCPTAISAVAASTEAASATRICLRPRRGDEAAHVSRRLRVGVAERGLDRAHEFLGPGRELVVDRAQELERRGEADVGDRRRLAADELLPSRKNAR